VKIPQASEFRSERYDYWMAYYDKRFHNRPPSELSPDRLKQKIRLREWLNQQQIQRRKPQMVQGAIPRDAPERVVRKQRPRVV
jgi:hypothetical protein